MFGQRVQLWWDLPLLESFELLRHVYRIPAAQYRRNLEEVRTVLELDSFLRTPVRQLSLGQRVRGELAAALLHDPEVVFLDEPTIGLDVVVKQRVRELLLRANAERGVTIFLTTHDLADIERLCTRVLLLDQGKLVFDGTVPELSRRFGHRRVLVVDLEVPAQALHLDGAEVIRVAGSRQWIAFDGDRMTAAQLVGAISRQAAIRDLTVEEPEIEEVVRQIYGGRAQPQSERTGT
jgi:ABC-2 type transport system ATP-binding protein